MNLNLAKINFLVLILVIESHGGLIDGVYDRIKNTTTGLRQDAKNAWNYGKGLVLHEETTEEHKDGLIGGMIHSTHDKIHSLHEQLWKVEDIPNDSGLLWNMWNRLKQRLAKAKHFIIGDGGKQIESSTKPLSEEAKLIKETMDKLYFDDGTRKIDGDAFNEAVENLRKKLSEMRKTTETTTIAPVHHGEGLIDVRLGSVGEEVEDNSADAAGVPNGIYDKVNKNINSGLETAKTGLNKVNDEAKAFKGRVEDAEAKEKELLDTTYNKLS